MTLESYVLTKSTFLLTKCSPPTILIKWTNLFRVKNLNGKFSKYQKQSPRLVPLKWFLKIKTAKFNQKYSKFIQNSFKNFRLKINNFIEKRLQDVCFLWNTNRMLLQKFLLKIKIAATGKFSEAASRRYFSK